MPIFHNKTRQSSSIPKKLIKGGRFYLVPIYYLLLTSELAREGIENSGSYRFADHIYENKPKGRFVVGKLLDRVFLKLKSARSLRSRYTHAKEEIEKLINDTDSAKTIDILSVPCGLTREFFEVAHELKITDSPHYGRVKWHGIDLDEELIDTLVGKNADLNHPVTFWAGDAFKEESYKNKDGYDMVISTGFTDFLNDQDVLSFYKIVYKNLRKDGIFFTSGMMPHALSEYLMRTFAELHTQYRSEEELRGLAVKAGFKTIRTYKNELQTILVATKG